MGLVLTHRPLGRCDRYWWSERLGKTARGGLGGVACAMQSERDLWLRWITLCLRRSARINRCTIGTRWTTGQGAGRAVGWSRGWRRTHRERGRRSGCVFARGEWRCATRRSIGALPWCRCR